jgi:hypothetical protein
MILAAWQSWLGLFLVLTIVFFVIRYPTKSNSTPGSFDSPVRRKPFFRATTIFILVVGGAFLILQLSNQT